MFIELDEIELLDFFESEPIVIGEYDQSNWLYKISDGNFKMIVLVSGYEEYVELSITYCDNIVYEQKIDNVIEIKKIDNMLKIITENGKAYYLKKDIQLGVCVE